ncbi:MAG: DsbA family protein, partial [Pseudomonadota bacterium]
GVRLADLFRDRLDDVNQMISQLKGVADSLGLAFGEREWTYNSRMAQELGKWAESRGRGEAFHMALFRAYFVDGDNIAKVPVLLDLAESLGLPVEEAREVLDRRTFQAAVDADWAHSRAMGITAVPTLFLKGSTLVGAQPYEIMEKFMGEQGVTRR